MELENSCYGRQGRVFDCRIYVVSYQNKRLNFAPLASKNWKTTNLEILKFEARFAYIKENKNYNRMKFDTFRNYAEFYIK